eukprot:GFUD01043296.1.p1 GENE.GFUD01043296.1~~GFUD01043296.1.p1  ORF type:complete len:610 (+),score=230.65 GFUD01043296.1:50-1879(+)
MSEADEKPKGEEEDAKVETAAEETKATEDVKDDSKQKEEVKDEENVNKGEVSSSEEKDTEVNGDDSEVILKPEGESENKEGEGDQLDESILDQSEIGDTKDNLDTSEVITVEDTNEGNVPSKTVPDVVFYDKVSEEEKKFYEENGPTPESVDTMNMQCTACWKQVNHHVTNNIMRHPDLGVAVCRPCKYFYDGDEAGEEWEKDDEGSDVYCKWCAQGGEVVGCDKCTHVFCKRCITRNLGRKKFSEINDSEEWGCFSCDPSQIYKERALMYAFSKWASDRKNKKKIKEKMKVEKRKSDVLKKNEIEKKKREDAKKRQKEQEKKNKIEEEASKVDNFIDENIHEAFDTLNIYQKCLQDEHKKWMRIRKSMNPNNTAMVAKSLRRIYAITKQNMELLDTALVQGYGDQFPEESDGKLKFGNLPNGDNATPSKSKPSPNKRKMKATPAKAKSRASTDNDIEVEEIVVNGEPVFGSMGDSDGVFDPSMLCSVEITAERDSDSSSPPPPKKQKISRKSTTITPVASKHNGPLRISKNMFTKKKKTPSKLKAASTKAESDSDIEEITIIDDDDSTGYVSQSTLDAIAAQNINQKANKFINSNKDDDSFDSDVSLE